MLRQSIRLRVNLIRHPAEGCPATHLSATLRHATRTARVCFSSGGSFMSARHRQRPHISFAFGKFLSAFFLPSSIQFKVNLSYRIIGNGNLPKPVRCKVAFLYRLQNCYVVVQER
jgi:hypothetical protein